ncbi:unnamed protein product [Trifolium pratense]|uniref:Uncharacterized protein n=1 Tax=Trifolium pratense TaxID=57577 RepID=A0ACB0MFB3_TRIPR|nr:unnamed protein product [Trifolium pratense]
MSGGFGGGSRATTCSLLLYTSFIVFTITLLFTTCNLSTVAVTIVSDPEPICLKRTSSPSSMDASITTSTSSSLDSSVISSIPSTTTV